MIFNFEFLINILLIVGIIFLGFAIYYLVTIGNKNVSDNKKIVFNVRKIRKILILGFLLFGLIFILFKYKIIFETINTLLFGIVISYIINPMVKYFENKGLKRAYAILIIYLIVLLLVILLGMIVVPQTIQQTKKLIISLPEFFRDIFVKLTDINNKIFKQYPTVSQIMYKTIQQLYQRLGNVQNYIMDAISKTGYFTSNIFSNILKLILIPVVTFYMLLDKEKCIDFIMELIPENNKTKFVDVCKDIDMAYSEFIRGRVIMAIFVGVLTTIFLLIMKVDFAIVIGILTTVGDIIPYIGPFIAVLPAFLIAFLTSPIKAIIVVIGFGLIQWVENNILAPKLLGTKVGLNPLMIIVSLIIGGGIFGVVGMILSVPFVATIKILYLHFKTDIEKFLKN